MSSSFTTNVGIPKSRGTYSIRDIRLILQSQGASGESSMEGSVTMEHTPPQIFTGIPPATLKVNLPPNNSLSPC